MHLDVAYITLHLLHSAGAIAFSMSTSTIIKTDLVHLTHSELNMTLLLLLLGNETNK